MLRLRHLVLTGLDYTFVLRKDYYIVSSEVSYYTTSVCVYTLIDVIVLQSTVKVKVPISLNLNLCSVKQAQVTDTERNFCFKVISPIRTLLLQAESSQGGSMNM